VTGDRYAGEWPAEQFRKRGVIYLPADKTASQIFIEALPLINGRRAGLLDHRRLIDQLIALERRTTFGTGRDTIGHPPNAHDDIAVAAAGAILLATAKRPTIRQGYYSAGIYAHQLAGWSSRHEDESDHSQIRYARVNEAGDEITSEQATAIAARKKAP
jgi:hypothetical protein